MKFLAHVMQCKYYWKVEKELQVAEFQQMLQRDFQVPQHSRRLWIYARRQNGTFRPYRVVSAGMLGVPHPPDAFLAFMSLGLLAWCAFAISWGQRQDMMSLRRIMQGAAGTSKMSGVGRTVQVQQSVIIMEVALSRHVSHSCINQLSLLGNGSAGMGI